MAGPPVARHTAARSALNRAAVTGVILLIVGATTAGAAWPGEEVAAFSGDVTETGSTVGAVLGLLVAGVGQLVLLVALIGYGVRLGTEAVEPP